MQALRILTILAAALAAPAAWADQITVVCPQDLRPALGRWLAFRQSQGHRVRVVDRVDTARPAAGGLLMLIGDGSAVGVPQRRVEARVVGRFGPEKGIPTDTPHADPDGDGLVDTAVGRLPFNDPSSLAWYLDRVIRSEQRPTGWGDTRLQIVAGAGGFGPTVDRVIEAAAHRLVDELAPAESAVSLRRIGGAGADGLHERADTLGGVWVWLGHGLRDRLPGLAARDLVRLTRGADIAVLLACYAGDPRAAANPHRPNHGQRSQARCHFGRFVAVQLDGIQSCAFGESQDLGGIGVDENANLQ